MCKIGLGIYELISFKLGMMLDTIELFILKPVWMILTFTQGHT